MEEKSGPYLSIVMCSRNDEYAGGHLSRVQASLDCLLRQLGEHAADAEIVMVDWNPPQGRPRLADALDFAAQPPGVEIRFIEVPARHHETLRNSDRTGMAIVVGVNVGIRRAKGRFILARANDTFLSAELAAFLARRDFREDHFYRCNRLDVALALAEETTLEACRTNVVAEHNMLQPAAYPPVRSLHTNASGDFILASREAWHRVRGFRESGSTMALDVDGLVLYALTALGIEQQVLPQSCCVYKLTHGMTTAHRVVKEPLPETLARFEERLIHEVEEAHVTCGESPLNLGDPVRFWAGLAFDMPRRSIRNMGDIGLPSYAEYLFQSMLLSSSRIALWKRVSPIGSRLHREVWRRILKVAREYQRSDPALFSPARLLRRAAYLCWMALRPKPYRTNGRSWGLGRIQLPERHFSRESQ